MTQLLIPGPAQAVLADKLGLAPDASVDEMLAEIERLQMAAAEGSRKKRKVRRGSVPAADMYADPNRD